MEVACEEGGELAREGQALWCRVRVGARCVGPRRGWRQGQEVAGELRRVREKGRPRLLARVPAWPRALRQLSVPSRAAGSRLLSPLEGL